MAATRFFVISFLRHPTISCEPYLSERIPRRKRRQHNIRLIREFSLRHFHLKNASFAQTFVWCLRRKDFSIDLLHYVFQKLMFIIYDDSDDCGLTSMRNNSRITVTSLFHGCAENELNKFIYDVTSALRHASSRRLAAFALPRERARCASG